MTQLPPRQLANLYPRSSAWSRFWEAPLCYRLAILGLAAAVGVVLIVFRDFGITWDEDWQKIYGDMLLSYYLSGFHDVSAFYFENLYYYGGLFDLVASFANTLSPLGVFETRHLMGGVVGVLGLAGTWRTARYLGGDRAGLLALVLLAITPGYVGHSFFNPKDGPFASGMIWCLYFTVRAAGQLPALPLRTALALGVALGLTLATRVVAVLAFVYLAAGFAVYLALEAAGGATARDIARASRRALVSFLPALPVAYILMGIFWPWSWRSPGNPWLAITTFSHFAWEGLVIFGGRAVFAFKLPWDYVVVLLGLTLPEVFLIGLVAAAVGGAFVLTRWRRIERVAALQFFLVLIAALFPIGYFIAFRPTAYNGIRHFLFVVPPLAVLAGIGFDWAWRRIERQSKQATKGIVLALGLAVATQIWIMARLHPNEYVYYNALAGGVRGAAHRYELDYWGNSLAEAAEALNQYVARERKPGEKRIYRVGICGYQLSVAYFLGPEFTDALNWHDADFYIAFTQSRCDRKMDGKVIATVERFGVPLAVVKDRRHLSSPAGRK